MSVRALLITPKPLAMEDDHSDLACTGVQYEPDDEAALVSFTLADGSAPVRTECIPVQSQHFPENQYQHHAHKYP